LPNLFVANELETMVALLLVFSLFSFLMGVARQYEIHISFLFSSLLIILTIFFGTVGLFGTTNSVRASGRQERKRNPKQ